MPNEIRYNQEYTREKSDSAFWTWDSPEWVATYEFEGRALEVWCVGEMRIHVPDSHESGGGIIRYADDLRQYGIHNNKDLEEFSNKYANDDIWQNNSWFELRDYEGQWIGDVFSGHVYHDVEEALDACAELLQDEEFLAEYPCLIPSDVVGSANDYRMS